MIFLTVGTQDPFDRLVEAVDNIAPLLKGEKIIAQVSKVNYKAVNMDVLEFVPPAEYDRYFAQARLIISHAGMGTIITALKMSKPIIVMPRMAKFKEQRNDHQLYTARAFKRLNYIHVADDEAELKEKVVGFFKNDEFVSLHSIGETASTDLIHAIRNDIGAI